SGYEPEVQKVFDKLLRQAGVLEEQYKATNIRKKNAETLRNKLATLSDNLKIRSESVGIIITMKFLFDGPIAILAIFLFQYLR
ncbi:hypothetical protein MJN76_30075, partial [Salmonella enterica subsp. enterica serovar Anatum]|nr:hypothetical protein [Salmonella enterica subsp. enterica serovar Anatum]